MARRSRIFGMTLDGAALRGAKHGKTLLALASARQVKMEGARGPTPLPARVGAALCVNDVKALEVEARLGPLVKNTGRKFVVVDEFGEWVEHSDDRAASDPRGDAACDEPDGGLS